MLGSYSKTQSWRSQRICFIREFRNGSVILETRKGPKSQVDRISHRPFTTMNKQGKNKLPNENCDWLSIKGGNESDPPSVRIDKPSKRGGRSKTWYGSRRSLGKKNPSCQVHIKLYHKKDASDSFCLLVFFAKAIERKITTVTNAGVCLRLSICITLRLKERRNKWDLNAFSFWNPVFRHWKQNLEVTSKGEAQQRNHNNHQRSAGEQNSKKWTQRTTSERK